MREERGKSENRGGKLKKGKRGKQREKGERDSCITKVLPRTDASSRQNLLIFPNKVCQVPRKPAEEVGVSDGGCHNYRWR